MRRFAFLISVLEDGEVMKDEHEYALCDELKQLQAQMLWLTESYDSNSR